MENIRLVQVGLRPTRRTVRDMVYQAKKRAHVSNVPFNIDFDDIHIPEKCPVLGIPIFCGTKQSCNNSPTLDRIIPELGYTKGNIIVMSSRANQLKSNATLQEVTLLNDFLQNFIREGFMNDA